ncbi:hypothetical protein PTT_12409 [Pyrenophora teres f. teres 0-1]|uniref:Uncharacterized protein n=1 Tax=Pyrenophora teres f. teres (strain 0-1) TaxID=861557 RepID=E3RTQ5_PYRTT|nr:hypothetical protein PTT_12409 [Pyrenophora teres f. teres 0-1]
MHPFTVFTNLIFFFFVTSHALPQTLPAAAEALRNDTIPTESVSIEKGCAQVRALENLDKLANNQTALDAMATHGKIAQGRADWIKNNDDKIVAKLNALKSNSTLMAGCEIINAQLDLSRRCAKLQKLQKLVDLAVDEKALLNTTAGDFLTQDQKDRLRQKADEVQLKLQNLKSNITLTRLCADDISMQQDGVIGMPDNAERKGTISMAKSGAVINRLSAMAITYLVLISLFLAFLFV